MSKTSGVRPAAGPETCRGHPVILPVTIPPTIPVIKPAVGGQSQAIAMPRHNGSATSTTTIDALKSAMKVVVLNGFSLCWH